MKSYKEIIIGDQFDKKESHSVKGCYPKMCWRCETKHNEGYMVKNLSKGRLIFFCKDCYDKLSS